MSAAKAGEAITIVIADDHQMVRAGLRMLLDAVEDFEVVSEAGDLSLTERRVAAYRPRVLVLDVNMPGGSSLPAIPRLRASVPETHIVVLTVRNDPELAREALRAGATAYVLKEAGGDGADTGRSPWPPPVAPTSIPSSGRGSPRKSRPVSVRPATSARARWRCCGSSPSGTPTARSPPTCI